MWRSTADQLPADGQDVWYCGPFIGVWAGRYEFHPDAFYCPHKFVGSGGCCDKFDAPYWAPRFRDEALPPEPPFIYDRDWSRQQDGSNVTH